MKHSATLHSRFGSNRSRPSCVRPFVEGLEDRLPPGNLFGEFWSTPALPVALSEPATTVLVQREDQRQPAPAAKESATPTTDRGQTVRLVSWEDGASPKAIARTVAADGIRGTQKAGGLFTDPLTGEEDPAAERLVYPALTPDFDAGRGFPDLRGSVSPAPDARAASPATGSVSISDARAGGSRETDLLVQALAVEPALNPAPRAGNLAERFAAAALPVGSAIGPAVAQRTVSLSASDFVAGALLFQLQSETEADLDELVPARLGSRVTVGKTAVPGLFEVRGSGDDLAQLAADIARQPSVSYVEPVQYARLALAPNDPSYTDGTLFNLNGTYGIRAPQAWDQLTNTIAVPVAVIDTGTDYLHPDLYNNIWINQGEIPAARLANLTDTDGDGVITFWDLNFTPDGTTFPNRGVGKITDSNGNGFIDAADLLAPFNPNGTGGWANGVSDDGDTYVDDIVGWNFVNNTNNPLDDNGHGTHVSGTLGAVGNNSTGVVGVSWRSRMMPLKIFDANGSSGTSTGVANAIRYAADHGARVSNNSYIIGSSSSATVYNAIDYARLQGMVYVVAAGNQAQNIDTSPIFPGSYTLENIIAVAATTSSGSLSSISNYGAVSVDLAAPGEDIYSTEAGGSYGYRTGTSFATPHVAGAVALVMAQNPSFTMAQAISRVLNTTTPLESVASITVTGGLLNAEQALSPNTNLSWSGTLTGPASATTQGTFTINRTYTVALNAVTSNFTISYYASTDATFGNADDLLLGSETITAAADKTVGSHAGTSPSLRIGRPGAQRILAVIDARDNVAETNEANNLAVSSTVTTVSGLTDVIVDNNQPGYSETGLGWTHATGSSTGFNSNSRQHSAGTGTSTASWQVTALPAGTYDVQVTWAAAANRATNAQFTVFDGSTLVRTVQINQQAAPTGTTVQGSVFQSLGPLNLTSGLLRVTLSDNANGVVVADAVRFLGVPASSSVQVLDDGDTPGFTATSGFFPFAGQGYQNDVTYAAAGTGSETATWTFTGLLPSLYRVSATWSEHANRATNAPFTVYDGTTSGTNLGTVLVNQELAPNHFTANGASWRNLGGTYSINSGTLTVRLTNNANEYVIADAVRIERLTTNPVTILDDGDTPGFSATSGFFSFAGQGYQNDVTYAAAGTGTQTATWTFSGLTAGTYRVSATWSIHANRATNAPFSVYNGTPIAANLLGTTLVNQEQAPGDFTSSGVGWRDLRTTSGADVFTLTGTTLTVRLTDNANEYVIADAIRIERLS